MPRPEMKIPVWPVARKSASTPRSAQFLLDRERRVLLAHRAIGSDGEQPLATSLLARSGHERLRGLAHLDEMAAAPLRRCRDLRYAVERLMQSRGHVEPGLERRDDGGNPGRGDEAAIIGNADDQRADAARGCLGRRQVGQAEIHLATGQAQLARAEFRPPLAYAGGSLCRRDVGRVAEEEEIRTLDHDYRCLHVTV